MYTERERDRQTERERDSGAQRDLRTYDVI